MNPFFAAVVQAVEEAVANALVANEEMTGRDGHRSRRCRASGSPRCSAPGTGRDGMGRSA